MKQTRLKVRLWQSSQLARDRRKWSLTTVWEWNLYILGRYAAGSWSSSESQPTFFIFGIIFGKTSDSKWKPSNFCLTHPPLLKRVSVCECVRVCVPVCCQWLHCSTWPTAFHTLQLQWLLFGFITYFLCVQTCTHTRSPINKAGHAVTPRHLFTYCPTQNSLLTTRLLIRMPSGMKSATKRHECRQTTNDMFAADPRRSLCSHQWLCARATGTFLSPHAVFLSTCVTWSKQKIMLLSIWLAVRDRQMSESQGWRTKALHVTTFPQQLVKHAGWKKNADRESAQSSNRETAIRRALSLAAVRRERLKPLWKSWRMYALTLRRLQKWNSFFSAACRLMDSSEPGNSRCCWMGPALVWLTPSERAGARTFCACERESDCTRACAFERLALSVRASAKRELPPASAHTPPSRAGEKLREDGAGRRGRRGRGWREGCWPCQSPWEPGGQQRAAFSRRKVNKRTQVKGF